MTPPPVTDPHFTPRPSLLEFPCHFTLKVVGIRSEHFAQTMFDLVRTHAPDLGEADVSMRPSREHHYLALTFTVHVHSQEQLNGIYRDLSSHPETRFVL